MRPSSTATIVVTFLAVLFSSGEIRADESDSGDRAAEALRVTTEAAKRYQFEVSSNPAYRLKFQPQSILRWSNPIAGEIYGNVFVWTHHGRPEVIGSIYQWYDPSTHGSHEFHSLSTQTIRGGRDGQLVWTTSEPGIKWQSVPKQPAVADSQTVRRRQTRSIARGFQVVKTDRSNVTRDLRMLAQPIYRYGGSDSGVIEGALFVFVQGTDPEVFLLMEARQDGEQLRWHYALAKMNSVQFVASYDSQEVWRAEIWPWRKVKNAKETYTSFGPFELESESNTQ